MAAGTLSYHVGLNKLLRGGGGDDDDDDEEFGCCHRAALGVVGGFVGAVAGATMGPLAMIGIIMLDAFMINTKGTTTAGAILGYTVIDTATLRKMKSFSYSLWFGFVSTLVAFSIVGSLANVCPCDQTIVEVAFGIRFVPTERYKTWKKTILPRIKKLEPDEGAGKDAVLLTALFAVIGAAIMFAYFLMLGMIFAYFFSRAQHLMQLPGY